MLLPDNIHPTLSIYYNGSIILRKLKNNRTQHVMELFESIKDESDMSLSIFMLSLDWLYLIDIAMVNDKGWVKLCL
jgi:hypothetical protein